MVNMAAKFAALALLASVVAASIQSRAFGGIGGGTNPFDGGSGSGSGSSGPNVNFQTTGAPFDVEKAIRTRQYHGVLALLAMVVLFPGGSIFVRVAPGRWAVLLHVLWQLVSLVVYLCAVGLGVYLVNTVRIPNQGDLMSNPRVNYHPIIGFVVLAMLSVQPILGLIHHVRFKQTGGRQAWSYLHLFNGRIFIMLGIANGGLGLWLAGESKKLKMAYVGVAVGMWTLWMLAALWGKWKRWRRSRLNRRNIRDDLKP